MPGRKRGLGAGSASASALPARAQTAILIVGSSVDCDASAHCALDAVDKARPDLKLQRTRAEGEGKRERGDPKQRLVGYGTVGIAYLDTYFGRAICAVGRVLCLAREIRVVVLLFGREAQQRFGREATLIGQRNDGVLNVIR